MNAIAQNIMLVDDSPIAVKKLKLMLEQLDFNVVATASSGKDVLETYRTVQPDLVTMDIVMPDVDGIEAARAVMAEFPSARIIMVTSMGQEQMVLEALQAGAKGYLIKPYQEIKLYEAIQKACKRELTQEKLAEEVDARKAEAARKKAGA